MGGGGATRRPRKVFKDNKAEQKDHSPEGRNGAGTLVAGMPYTTPWGETGWYSGMVNGSGKPHGQGYMRYKSGKQAKCDWLNGYSDEFLEKWGKTESGFCADANPLEVKGRQEATQRAGASQGTTELRPSTRNGTSPCNCSTTPPAGRSNHSPKPESIHRGLSGEEFPP